MDIPWNVLWSHGIVGWDGQWDIRASVRGTGRHPMECPMIPWDRGMGWDRQEDTHASVRGTGGHPVECPMVPWDSGMGWTMGHTHFCERER